MSIEFPEDLLPLPGGITGTERMLADKNTVTVEQLAGFVQSSLGIDVSPIELSLTSINPEIENIEWKAGYLARVGPLVMLQGQFAYTCNDPTADFAIFNVHDLPQNGVPTPSVSPVGGLAGRLGGPAPHDKEDGFGVVINYSDPSNGSLAIRVNNPGYQTAHRQITFFISYLTNE